MTFPCNKFGDQMSSTASNVFLLHYYCICHFTWWRWKPAAVLCRMFSERWTALGNTINQSLTFPPASLLRLMFEVFSWISQQVIHFRKTIWFKRSFSLQDKLKSLSWFPNFLVCPIVRSKIAFCSFFCDDACPRTLWKHSHEPMPYINLNVNYFL